MAERFHGGCLCGALRYAIEGPIRDAAYCHCRRCQRASGAPVVLWLTVAVERFVQLGAAPRVFRASSASARLFCGRCGTPVAMTVQASPDTVDVAVATLDTPGAVSPAYHIWHASRLPGFEIRDTLPRHADDGPDAQRTPSP